MTLRNCSSDLLSLKFFFSKDDSSDFNPGSEEESADEYSGSDYEPDELVRAAKRKARQKKARGRGRGSTTR